MAIFGRACGAKNVIILIHFPSRNNQTAIFFGPPAAAHKFAAITISQKFPAAEGGRDPKPRGGSSFEEGGAYGLISPDWVKYTIVFAKNVLSTLDVSEKTDVWGYFA